MAAPITDNAAPMTPPINSSFTDSLASGTDSVQYVYHKIYNIQQ